MNFQITQLEFTCTCGRSGLRLSLANQSTVCPNVRCERAYSAKYAEPDSDPSENFHFPARAIQVVQVSGFEDDMEPSNALIQKELTQASELPSGIDPATGKLQTLKSREIVSDLWNKIVSGYFPKGKA